jgi:hypothetical protein
MNFEDRVAAVAKFGVTERQARFLTTVMLHSGRTHLRTASTPVGATAPRSRIARHQMTRRGACESMRLRRKQLARSAARPSGGAFCRRCRPWRW